MDQSNEALLSGRLRIPDHVLFQEVAGEAALLNINSELYFGLDEVGTRMWKALRDAATIGRALDALTEIYDAAPDEIRRDLIELVHELKHHGLVDVDL